MRVFSQINKYRKKKLEFRFKTWLNLQCIHYATFKLVTSQEFFFVQPISF